MKWSCSAVRRRLSEYHDGELTIDQRVAIQEHLRRCEACDAEAHLLDSVGIGLRAAAAQRACADDSQRLDGLAAGVMSRLRAEREESLSSTVHRMFEDLHLVWAAVGATAATFACLAITVGILYASKAEHPDSLAGLIDTIRLNDSTDMGRPRSPRGIVMPRLEVPAPGMPRLADAVPELATGQQEIMLDATITRDGRVDMASLQLMNPDGPTGQRQESDWTKVGNVLDSVARARFEPARVDGEPVSMKMFWFLTQTTVVGEANQSQAIGPVARPRARGHVQHTLANLATHAA